MDSRLNKNLLPEAALLDLLAVDDEEAFRVLYQRHWQDLYRMSFFVLKDAAQSMDLVQEVFVWLWEHRQQLTIHSSLKGYLATAVKFKAANLIRHHKVRRGFYQEMERIQLTTDTSPEAELEVKELEGILRQAVDELPDKCKMVYQLSRERRLSNQKIADHLGISVKTVENQMTIALKRLRSALAHFISLFLLLVLH